MSIVNNKDQGVEKKMTSIVQQIYSRGEIEEVRYNDLSLKPIMVLNNQFPDTGGLQSAKKKRENSAQSLTEGIICALMREGRLTGKKVRCYLIFKKAIEELRNKKYNPAQVLVTAIENLAPLETTINLLIRGKRLQKAVDVSRHRRIDLAIRLLAKEVISQRRGSKNLREIALAEELLKSSKKEVSGKAYSRKLDIERIAKISR